MHVLLTGLSGAGKSTVGPLVAAKLGRPFVDLDREIERNAGMSVAEIFASQGEDAFRAREKEALIGLRAWSDAVVSLGAGAMANEESSAIVSSLGTLVWLSVPASVAATRLAGAQERPLLKEGVAHEKLQELLSTRLPYYSRAAFIVDARDGVDLTAERVVRALDGAERVEVVQSHRGPYAVRVWHGGPEKLAFAIAAHSGLNAGCRCVLVCDKHVADRSEAIARSLVDMGLRAHVVRVDAGEELKQLTSIETMGLALEQLQADRDTVLVAIGGGSLTDAVGFLASCFRRGVRWVSVPTTLLGMVDSSLGGKTGVNLAHGKNLLGAFYPPIAVLSDTAWLETLDPRELRSGCAEMLKVGATHDAAYFAALGSLNPERFEPSSLESILAIAKAASIKARIVSEDEFEHGIRKVLNFGHTFGHAFESAGQLRTLKHGEAIALGMVAETEFALGRGHAGADVLTALNAAMGSLGIDQNWRKFARQAKPYVGSDKKRKYRHVRLAIVPKLGEFAWLDAEVSELEDFLEVEGARP
jgi:shikimate kinase / 3-dehydroquinate synthase